MIFDKASLIKKMNRKDKRFKELSTAEQDEIIQKGINYLQDATKWFRHFEGYYLTTLIENGINTVATLKNPNGVSSIVLTKNDEKVSANIDVTVNRNDNYSISIDFTDGANYDDIIIETIWYVYPDVNEDIDTNSNIIELIQYASYMKMFEEFDDTDRESRNKQRFDDLLGTGSLNLVNEFNDIPMNNFS